MDDTFNDAWGRRRRTVLQAALGAALVPVAARGAAAAAASPSSAPAGAAPVRVPGLEHVFSVEAQVGAPLELGVVDGVRKRVIPILGGRVFGPRLQGEVLPGGADWQGIRETTVADIYARYTLRTVEGTIISVTNPGIRRGPPEVMKRLIAGERVDPSLYYFRTTPSFEVAAGPYGWMRENVFVCSGIREPDRVRLEYFVVL